MQRACSSSQCPSHRTTSGESQACSFTALHFTHSDCVAGWHVNLPGWYRHPSNICSNMNMIQSHSPPFLRSLYDAHPAIFKGKKVLKVICYIWSCLFVRWNFKVVVYHFQLTHPSRIGFYDTLPCMMARCINNEYLHSNVRHLYFHRYIYDDPHLKGVVTKLELIPLVLTHPGIEVSICVKYISHRGPYRSDVKSGDPCVILVIKFHISYKCCYWMPLYAGTHVVNDQYHDVPRNSKIGHIHN